MKIQLIQVGKTAKDYLINGIEEYIKRLKRYVPLEIITIGDIKGAKNMSPIEIKDKEGKKIIEKISGNDFVIFLDEKGKSYTSIEFSKFIEFNINQGIKRLVFIIGGAYGFSNEMYNRADAKISLSKMTFSHQMIRVFFLEQLYRAFTIIKGEPYHNE